MNTEVLKITSLVSDIDKINRAGEMLSSGCVVAIPTETVYGLAANALDETAVANIFAVKGRPADNPLIVHIADLCDLERLCIDIPESAFTLAHTFWPGPLTMILKKQPIVPSITTGGLDTVAIRCPRGRFARAVIRATGLPLAAPSANISGKPSPTRAEHVIRDLDGKIPAIVDGGECSVGLESTVIDMTRETPTLLRPGAITLAQLREVLGEVNVDACVTQKVDVTTARSPGMKYRHYAPSAPVTILNGSVSAVYDYVKQNSHGRDVALLCFEEERESFFGCGATIVTYGSEANPEELARELFNALRQLDDMDVEQIYAREPKLGDGMELAVINRLEKAAGFSRMTL